MRELFTILIAISGVCLTRAAHAAESHGINSTIYLDVFGYGGTTLATQQTPTGSNSPNLSQQGIGLSAGPMWSGFFLAAGTDYRTVANAEPPLSQIGSFEGTRWAPITAATGYLGDEFLLKIEYEPYGVYQLKQPTYLGSTISYTTGGGYRVSFLYAVWAGLMFGPSYESLQFNTMLDTIYGQQNGQTLNLVQYSLMGAYVF